jgi:glucosyl-3-phosphoglycerate synthase
MKSKPEQIAVVGTTAEQIAALLPFARVLASDTTRTQGRAVSELIVGLVQVAEGESLSAGARAVQEFRGALQGLPQRPDTRIAVHVTHDPWQEAAQVLLDEKSKLALLHAAEIPPANVLRDFPADLAIINGQLPERIEHILLPIRGGPHAALALQIALAIAEICHADITLLHATPPSLLREEQTRELFRHLDSLPEIKTVLRVRGDAVPVILEQAKPEAHQLLVMGSVARPRSGDPPIGPTAQQVMSASKIPTIIVKTRRLPELAPSDAAAPVDYTISVVVDKWFAENTFHAHEFADIRKLVEWKEREGLTISLGLPTLDEEATIGKVIKTMRKDFMEEYPLLDEIVVIDSNSTDRTVEIAKEMGVPVFKHPEVLTQYGVWAGKGEALWNSLYVLKGDLIAWIDTDIANIHPRFVYGILGPLIREPRLMYVKGFYQRPLRLGRKREARGGGRVTELVARPMLNLFYPELSGFIQPLAGEYAGRREALEAVPFFVGYGVETGLLIDILTRFGLSAMGQVDLEERVHRNQSLIALSQMAFEIIQVVMARVGEKRGLELVDEVNKSIKLIRHEAEAFQLDIAEIRARERPPMLTIPEYRAARGLK